MTGFGIAAKAAFDKAAALVKAGQFEAARKVELAESDRIVIENRISAACAKTANTTLTKEQ